MFNLTTRLRMCSLVGIGLAFIVGSQHTSTAQTSYTVTDLGSLGGPGALAMGMNNKGQVVGGSSTTAGGSIQPFVWTPTTPNGTTGSMRKLSVPRGYTWGRARSINSVGQIAGVGGGDWNALLWSPDGTVTNLGYMTKNPTAAWAESINDSGQVAGAGQDPAGRWAPFLWKPAAPNGTKGKMYQIGPVSWGGNNDYSMHLINAFGQVVYPVSGGSVLWTPSSANGTSGSSVNLPLVNPPVGLNNFGQVAALDSSAAPSLWTPFSPNTSSGSVTTLAPSGGWTGPTNNLGECVGFDANGHLFLWTPSSPNETTGTLLDLTTATMFDPAGNPDSSWTFTSAVAINDQGQIAGVGTHNGVSRAYLLTKRP